MSKAAVLVASLQQLAPCGVEAFMMVCQHGPVTLPCLHEPRLREVVVWAMVWAGLLGSMAMLVSDMLHSTPGSCIDKVGCRAPALLSPDATAASILTLGQITVRHVVLMKHR